MRKIVTLILGAAVALMFSGCQLFDDKANEIKNQMPQPSEKVEMEKNKKYEINRGDKIEKVSANPQLKIDSNLNTGKTEVTLISGEANIIRK